MLIRSVLRTIRKSLGRYLAILAIIALGVGFFAGLRVTKEAMVRTTDGYLRELCLYDYRLISTLGLTGDDVAAFRQLDGIESAEGAYNADLMVAEEGGTEKVFHAHSLSGKMNLPDLREGRMPQNAGECLLDARYFSSSMIGKTFHLSAGNPEDTKAQFATDTFLVVGLVNSPNYLNFERGSTALGSGSVSGFLYLLPEAFQMDYYTEIYLKLPDGGFEIYSDAYESAVDAVRERVETLLAERAAIRYDDLVTAPKKTIEEKRAELMKSQTTLDEKRAELTAGQATLDAQREALAAKQKELDAQRAALEGTPQYEVMLPQLEAAQAQINAGVAKIAEKQAELDAGTAELNAAQQELNEGQAQLEEAEARLAEISPATTFALDRTANVGYVSFESDTSIVSGVSQVFPLFFFLVAALVCITTMTRMVGEQRTENGVLKALGYSEGAIVGQYLFYAGSASLLGCVAGFLIGSRFMPMALWQVYHIMYSVQRPIAFVLDFKLFALCTAIYLFCALGATWLVCHRDLRETSAQLLRPKAPGAGKRILLERVGFLWRHIPFLHKVSIRNIVRYKKRLFMMILGIGGCTALLLTGFGIKDSITPIAERQYEEIDLFDAKVTFLDPMDEESRAAFCRKTESVSAGVAFAHASGMKAMLEGAEKSINGVVFSRAPNGFLDLHSGETKLAYPTAGQAVINYRFARENNISVGDVLDIADADYRTVRVTVTGIFDNYIYDYVYLSADTFTAAWGEEPACNTAYVNFPDGKDAHEAGTVLLDAENVASVMLTADMRTRVANSLGSMNYIVLIVLVCAGALAFIVLYNLTNIMIMERERELATLKVLGFTMGEQNAYVFRENLVLTGVSALFGIPMGIALLHYVMAQIKISTMYFGCQLSVGSYFFAVLLTFVFTLVVDFLLLGKIRRVNMAEAMKAIE